MKSQRLGKRQIVLLGVGHTNAHIVRMWQMHPMDDADLTCVSDRPIATYSGMLPAALAGQVARQDMEIDLRRFCASAGARLIVEQVQNIDQTSGQLVFASRPAVPFDVLSIGIGSVPSTRSLDEDDPEASGSCILKIKPMQNFFDRLSEKLRALKGKSPLRVAIVGGGVAGVEILFCLPNFLKTSGFVESSLQLITRGPQVLPAEQANTRRLATREMQRRGNQITCNKTVVGAGPEHLEFDDGERQPIDLAIWATGAAPPPALQRLGLATDARGFLLTDEFLRVPSNAFAVADSAPVTDIEKPRGFREKRCTIFAVGDTGSIPGKEVPKAGVYAVRQGPILWENIQRSLQERELRAYQPQSSFLSLINMGNGRAIGQWKGLAFSGSWVYSLKNWIDSKFMEKFSPRPMNSSTDETEMQCQGCGCKLDFDTLEAAMSQFPTSDRLTLDDAAEIGREKGFRHFASTDFFTSPVDDAYLFGRLAALHAASDLLATGVAVSDALANVVVPEGAPAAQQRLLADLLCGASTEFERMEAKIVGGHTIVGPRLEAGFTVIGSPWQSHILAKANLRPGDRLYLTKPLGTGVLLAAHMQARCSAAAYDQLIEWMLRPQQKYAECAVTCGVQAATDITGFGLAGHLLEMVRASQVSVRLSLASIPVLEPAVQYSQDGISSSLFPGNLRAERAILANEETRNDPKYPLLFDPQTCGGLLLGIPPRAEQEFLDQIKRQGLPEPSCIGQACLGSERKSIEIQNEYFAPT